VRIAGGARSSLDAQPRVGVSATPCCVPRVVGGGLSHPTKRWNCCQENGRFDSCDLTGLLVADGSWPVWFSNLLMTATRPHAPCPNHRAPGFAVLYGSTGTETHRAMMLFQQERSDKRIFTTSLRQALATQFSPVIPSLSTAHRALPSSLCRFGPLVLAMDGGVSTLRWEPSADLPTTFTQARGIVSWELRILSLSRQR